MVNTISQKKSVKTETRERVSFETCRAKVVEKYAQLIYADIWFIESVYSRSPSMGRIQRPESYGGWVQQSLHTVIKDLGYIYQGGGCVNNCEREVYMLPSCQLSPSCD